MPAYEYEGGELAVFQHAVHWKSYFRSHIRAYIRGAVLEVGAGIGATTQLLCDGTQEGWTCLEPDEQLAEEMRQRFAQQPPAVSTNIIVGTLAELPATRTFDSILYIDVLEHIPEDLQELARAAELLNRGGSLIVVAPAHQWLFTEFDRAIGHYRRYSARTLRQVVPPELQCTKLRYLDSIGMFASLANRFLLRSSTPSLRQIRFWDSVLVRLSQVVDPLLVNSVGKSVVGVWRKA